jgi:uncharacterized phiE125 gp8 family phage protein
MYSLGDLQTGMTAGSYAINLSSLAQYGHFVTVTVTETAAAAASVNGFALLSVADEHSSSGNIRRAAVIGPMMAYSGAEWATNYAAPTMASYAMLKRMGYDAEILPLYDSSPILDSGDKTHDLFVWPATAHAGLWSTWTSGSGKPIGRLVKGGTAIPLICLGVTSNNNATLLANIGAGDRDTETYRKIVFSSDSASWYVPNAGTYQVTQQAHMSDFRTIATDSALAGKIAWSYRGSAGRVYVAAGFNGANDCNMLPLILGEAVSDGVIDAPPRKVKVVLDIDDMPACEGGAVGIMTLSDLSSVYTELQAMQMPCTFGIRVEDITAGRQQSAISAFVSQRSVLAGGLIYPIVHNGNWFWKDGTKAVKHAAYTSDISVARGSGISVGSDANQLNAYGYTYFNNNAFDEETTQLGQPGSSASASTDNRTRSAGYGWRVIRADGIGGLNTETIGEPSSVFGVTLHRGIRIVASHVHISASDKSVDFDDGSPTRPGGFFIARNPHQPAPAGFFISGLTMQTPITPPAAEPLTLAEAKLHLRVDADLTDDDTLISALIVTARQQAEHRTGRAMVTQQWRYSVDTFPADSLELPLPKLQSVQSVSYLDNNGTRQALANTEYDVITDELVGRIIPAYGKSWPSCREHPGSVRVDYTCGYGAAADVPQSIKAWMLLAIATWYENREALTAGQPVAELPRCFWEGLLDPFWVPGV